jgi:hypothetical protein
MGPELVGLKANEWTYKRGIYGQSGRNILYSLPERSYENSA